VDLVRPKGAALFAGAGGMSQGFLDAGFDVLLATDADGHAGETYLANHPGVPFIIADAKDKSQLSAQIILDRIGFEKGQLDIVFGGPPCRGFSNGNRKNGGPHNEHNTLVVEFARLVAGLAPRWFVLENVIGLYYMREIREEFETLLGEAYKIKAKILNAADFGVPQIRRRVIFVGNRVGVDFEFPEGGFAPRKNTKKNKERYVTVWEAVSDLLRLGTTTGQDEMPYTHLPKNPYQEMMREGSEKVFNHTITKSSPEVLERYALIGQGKNWSSLPDEMILKWRKTPLDKVKTYSHSNLYLRLDPDKPSVTVGNFRKSMYIHPIEDRGLSLREAARLQSFPDWYRFKGGISHDQQHIGNATPPLLARAVAQKILSVLDGTKKEHADVQSPKTQEISAEPSSLV